MDEESFVVFLYGTVYDKAFIVLNKMTSIFRNSVEESVYHGVKLKFSLTEAKEGDTWEKILERLFSQQKSFLFPPKTG